MTCVKINHNVDKRLQMYVYRMVYTIIGPIFYKMKFLYSHFTVIPKYEFSHGM